MTTIVLGAGVVGVTTAYYLARDGHRVVVIDRQNAAGLETSFANGSLVTPGMSDPWAAPGIPALILKHWGREDAPFLVRLSAVPGMLGWGLGFLRNCPPSRWRHNTEIVLRLAVHSRDALDALTAETGIEYHRFERGNLRVHRDVHSLRQAAKAGAMYRELGHETRMLDAAACVALEPALRPIERQLAGGVHYPAERAGDCRLFTQNLAKLAHELGVDFRFATTIQGLEAEADGIAAVHTSAGRIAGERFVLSLASHSTAMAGRIGIRLPVQPVKGYSATVPVGGWNGAPVMPIVDDHRKAAVTRLGERLRIAGTAEFAGFDTRDNPRRSAMLLTVLRELFPEYPGTTGEVQNWHGLRPMTPDGRPILGATRYPNLFVNTGHGPLGWTLACGSARVMASLVAGRRPEIDIAGFGLDRF